MGDYGVFHDPAMIGIKGLEHLFAPPRPSMPSTDDVKTVIDELVQRAYDAGVIHGRELERNAHTGSDAADLTSFILHRDRNIIRKDFDTDRPRRDRFD